MARTTLAPQAVNTAGGLLNTVYTVFPGSGAGNGFQIVNDGHTTIQVNNGSAGPRTLTVKSNGKVLSGITMPDKTYTITNAQIATIGPFDQQYYSDANGNLLVDIDTLTSVTCAALSIPLASV